MIPVLGFAGFSGMGKTTLIEKLIICLKNRGIRTAVIKHDVHGICFDQSGKDSARFGDAGAEKVILTSPGYTVTMENREKSFRESLKEISEVDLILVEGYKYENIPRIGIYRAVGKEGLPQPPETYLAIVTDQVIEGCSVPCFGFEETERITEFILKYFVLSS